MFQSPTNRVNTSKGAALCVACRRRAFVSIPYKSGQHFKNVDVEELKKGGACRVSIPYKSGQHFKIYPGCPWKTVPILGFNPLQIGSTLQNLDYLKAWDFTVWAFQSPTNRVNTSKNGRRPRTKALAATFQSPTNRVNTSKETCGYIDLEADDGFQSPTNRVNTSKKFNVRLAALTPSKVSIPYKSGQHFKIEPHPKSRRQKYCSCFNPLQIGSTLQKRKGRGAHRARTLFQSPTNRVNTSKTNASSTGI